MGTVLLAVASPEQWGPVLFATLVPLGVLIIGGLLHVVYRTGKLATEVEHLRGDINRMWNAGHEALERREQ